MKKFAFVLCICFAFLVIMCGCRQNHTQSTYRAVTQVDVITERNRQQIHLGYNTSEKMRPILMYLRLMKPEGKPVHPENTKEDVFLICISLSDGTKHYYRQAAHSYISKNTGPWKSINPEYATNLYTILRALPADV